MTQSLHELSEADLAGLAVIASESLVATAAVRLVVGKMGIPLFIFVFLVIEAIVSLTAVHRWRQQRRPRSAKAYLIAFSICAFCAAISIVTLLMGIDAHFIYFLTIVLTGAAMITMGTFARQKYLERKKPPTVPLQLN